MTRKHFEAIAALLRAARSEARNGVSAEEIVSRLTLRMANECTKHNAYFDYDRFFAAAGRDE